jgi:hypothetical protein
MDALTGCSSEAKLVGANGLFLVGRLNVVN